VQRERFAPDEGIAAVKGNGVDVITVAGLRKGFGDVEALAGISFAVRRGELYGFLGPNGAGKTTTINVLTGLARPDAGTIRVGGIDCTSDPRAAQRLIGVVPDESNLYPELTGFDNLCFCASRSGMRKAERSSRATELLAAFGLADAADRRFDGYSRGMKRKLAIAAGIIHRPPILFLDEPTTGIDVASARQIRQMIAGLRAAGATTFLTTHYIEEAERLCDRIAFIVSGRIVAIDAVERLLQPVQGRHVVQISCAKTIGEARDALRAAFPALEFSFPSDRLVRVEGGDPIRVGPLVRVLEEAGAEVAEARRVRLSLEDVFVRLTGIEADIMRREKERKGGPA